MKVKIDVKNLNLWYGEKQALFNINMPIYENKITALIGPSGCGKSTLLKKLTGADVEINSYPFTTKGINVGYMEEIQMVDTPGLLDRPLYERNDIELQAILALNYLANLVLFIVDASEFCGYTIDEQLNLLKEIKELFKVPIVVAINKVDLVNEKRIKEIEDKLKDIEVKAIYKISADKGIGLEELKKGIKKLALELYSAK